MRTAAVSLIIAIVTIPLLAQTRPAPKIFRPSQRAQAAEAEVKQAAEQLGHDKKIYDRDLAVLRRLRSADNSLVDTMQPANAVQKAYEEVDEAKSLGPEFYVMQGVLESLKELEGARRSPASADFGRLRSTIRVKAVAPASRVVVRNSLLLQEETLAWIKVQQQISNHLKTMSEISSESLRASE